MKTNRIKVKGDHSECGPDCYITGDSCYEEQPKINCGCGIGPQNIHKHGIADSILALDHKTPERRRR